MAHSHSSLRAATDDLRGTLDAVEPLADRIERTRRKAFAKAKHDVADVRLTIARGRGFGPEEARKVCEALALLLDELGPR
jgi:hypothetical protein